MSPTPIPLARLLADHPVIPSIKDEQGLQAMLDSPCRVGFILYGSILTIASQTARMQAAGKVPFVDVDLLAGLSQQPAAVEFLARHTRTMGVLSSKAHVVKAAGGSPLYGVHRHFMIDSMAFHNLERQVQLAKPDAVEILPGCIPKVIAWLRDSVNVPILAGGLIHDTDDVRSVLDAGATAVATSNQELWTV